MLPFHGYFAIRVYQETKFHPTEWDEKNILTTLIFKKYWSQLKKSKRKFVFQSIKENRKRNLGAYVHTRTQA